MKRTKAEVEKLLEAAEERITDLEIKLGQAEHRATKFEESSKGWEEVAFKHQEAAIAGQTRANNYLQVLRDIVGG